LSSDADRCKAKDGADPTNQLSTEKAGDELVSGEDRQGGLIRLAVWLSYFRGPGSYWLFLVVIFGYTVELSACNERESERERERELAAMIHP
jgi:hypothetical protein